MVSDARQVASGVQGLYNLVVRIFDRRKDIPLGYPQIVHAVFFSYFISAYLVIKS